METNQNQNQNQLPTYNQVLEVIDGEKKQHSFIKVTETSAPQDNLITRTVYATIGILAFFGPLIAIIIWSNDPIGILKYRYSFEDPEIGYTHVSDCLRPDVFLFVISPFMVILGIVCLRALFLLQERDANFNRYRCSMVDAVNWFIVVTVCVYVGVCLFGANSGSVNFTLPDNLKDGTIAYSSDGYQLENKNGCPHYYYDHHFWSYFAVFYITMLPHTFSIFAMCCLFIYGLWFCVCGNWKKCEK